jgi:hypothetical protein
MSMNTVLAGRHWPSTPHHPTAMAYNITDRARTERLSIIRGELLERIRPVCGRMPQDLFLEMVESMAAIQLKYELRTSPDERTNR